MTSSDVDNQPETKKENVPQTRDLHTPENQSGKEEEKKKSSARLPHGFLRPVSQWERRKTDHADARDGSKLDSEWWSLAPGIQSQHREPDSSEISESSPDNEEKSRGPLDKLLRLVSRSNWNNRTQRLMSSNPSFVSAQLGLPHVQMLRNRDSVRATLCVQTEKTTTKSKFRPYISPFSPPPGNYLSLSVVNCSTTFALIFWTNYLEIRTIGQTNEVCLLSIYKCSIFILQEILTSESLKCTVN